MFRKAPIIFLLILGCGAVRLFGAASTPNPGLRYYYPAPDVPVVDIEADVIVYGGTSGGVVAAVQAVRMGKSAAIVVFGRHVGGMTSGGLTQTDGVDAAVQGGITREYFSATGNTGFKPSKAEEVFENLLANPIPGATHDGPVPTFYEQRLASVEKRDGRIVAIHMENGSVFRGKMFIDCTYEGELLAGAGVSFTYGRESGATYGEALGGRRPPKTTTGANAYVEEGNPSRGLIYNLLNESPGNAGDGDSYVQAYNFRMYTVQSSNPASFQPLFPPAVYNPGMFEVIYRYHRAGGDTSMTVANDVNNNEVFGPNGVSTDHIGGNRWPNGSGGWIPWSEADYATREKIYQDHVSWQAGMLWYLKNDARYRALATDLSLSSTIRANIQALLAKVDQLGLAPGEYPETAGWPHELYVREGRRMVSDVVVTQAHCERKVVEAESVGLANYMMDSHSCRRVPGAGGVVHFEGGLSQGLPGPWRIPYRSIVPRKSECRNLVVPWAISSSHVAFCSMRMEPCFMVLAQSGATAAVLAIDGNIDLQDLEYSKLRMHLLAGGQLLGDPPASTDSGIIVDNTAATGVTVSGTWFASTASTGYWGSNYLHDGNTGAGTSPVAKSVRFTPDLPSAGDYEVYLRWVENVNRATNAPIDVIHAGGTSTFTQNQRTNGGKWGQLGTFTFAAGSGGSVLIRNNGADGYVIADAVRFVNSTATAPLPAVHVLAGDANADEADGSPAVFRFVRDTDSVAAPLAVGLSVGGNAIAGTHYQPLPLEVVIPAGKRSVDLPVTPVGDSIAQGPRTVTAAVLPSGSVFVGGNGVATVIIRDKPYDGWRHAHFAVGGEENAAASGPDADPDQDGLVNRLEFLLGSDPTGGAGTRIPTVTFSVDAGGKKWLSLVYWRSGAAKMLAPEVQSSGTLRLETWSIASGNLQTLFHDPATGDRQFRYSMEVTGLPLMFLRLALRE